MGKVATYCIRDFIVQFSFDYVFMIDTSVRNTRYWCLRKLNDIAFDNAIERQPFKDIFAVEICQQIFKAFLAVAFWVDSRYVLQRISICRGKSKAEIILV